MARSLHGLWRITAQPIPTLDAPARVTAGVRPLSPRLSSTLLFAVAFVFSCSVVGFAATYAHFWGDDLSTFRMLRHRPLLEVAFTNLGGQYVPLHRVAYWFLQTVCPMNFGAALGLLVGCHALAAIYLYRILELLLPGRATALWVAVYLVHPLAGANFLWFTSGLTRYPYVASLLAAVFHYLSFVATARRRHLLALLLAYVVSLGFYAKTIFFPFYLVGIEIGARSLALLPPPRVAWRGRCAVVAFGLACSALYTHVCRAALDPPVARMNTDVMSIARMIASSFESLVGRTLLRSAPMETREATLLLLVAALLGAVGVRRAPRIAIPLCALGVLLTLNFLLLAVSCRVFLFGEVLVTKDPRYYYEVWPLVVITGVMVVEGLRSAPHRGTSPSPQRGFHLVVPVVLGLYAAQAFDAYTEIAHRHFWRSSVLRSYVENVEKALARRGEDAPEPLILDAPLPIVLKTLDCTFIDHSDFFDAMGLPGRFVGPAQARYRILDDGRLVDRIPGAMLERR